MKNENDKSTHTPPNHDNIHNLQFRMLEWTEAWEEDAVLEEGEAPHRVTRRTRYEVYVLNPGDVFAGFGGSRHGLCVKKTASLIIREYSYAGTMTDTEFDVNSAKTWEWIGRRQRAKGRRDASTVTKVLGECADYLSYAVETAAGGDDDAVQLAKSARGALVAFESINSVGE